jgi:SAM-dependent methyltransferase
VKHTLNGRARRTATKQDIPSAEALFASFPYANAAERAYLRQHPERVAANLRALARLDLSAGARMLDIGCAWGGFSLLARQYLGLDVVGLDRYADLVTAAQARGIPAFQTDVEREGIPLASSSLDVVWFDSVIEHLYDPTVALAEIYRVLRPAGTLLLGCPNVTSLNRRLQMGVGLNPFSQYHRYNAIEGRPPILKCSVLYSPADVVEILWTRFTAEQVDYAVHLDLAERAHASLGLRAWDIVRRALCRLSPSWSDSFLVTMRSDKGGTFGQGKSSAIPLPPRYPPGEAPSYACQYVDRTGDPVLAPGETVELAVRYRNVGTQPWERTGEHPVRLGTCQPQDRESALAAEGWLAPHRPAALEEAAVAPGEVGTFRFPVAAPGRPEYFREHFCPLAEGAAWMEDWGLYWGVEVRPGP